MLQFLLKYAVYHLIFALALLATHQALQWPFSIVSRRVVYILLIAPLLFYCDVLMKFCSLCTGMLFLLNAGIITLAVYKAPLRDLLKVYNMLLGCGQKYWNVYDSLSIRNIIQYTICPAQWRVVHRNNLRNPKRI